LTAGSFPHYNFSSVYRIFTKHGHIIPLWKGKNPMYFGVIRSKVKVTVTINRILTTWSFPHNNFSSVYWIFTKLGHMIPLWKGKNPIYFGVITILPFDNLYRRAYFVMHTFLVFIIKIICLKHNIVYFIVEKSINDRRSNIMLYILKS
jgi:hypothetical protein